MTHPPDPAIPSTTAATGAVAQSRDGAGAGAAAQEPTRAPDVADDPARDGFDIGAGVVRAARTVPYERGTDDPVYRPLWIYALDPAASALEGAQAIINVPYEPLGPGPVGALFRVEAVDLGVGVTYRRIDPESPRVLIGSGRRPSPADPQFHQQMVYAVCSAVYATFRSALGRHVAWGFDATNDSATRLTLYPHGGRAENAWYDAEAGALRFGYFEAGREVADRNVPGGFVFTCLSHDIVVHEVTHALLDGLRSHLDVPTHGDVLGFHEGFADLVAVFQHFSYHEVVRAAIAASRGSLTRAHLLTDIARQFGHTSRDTTPSAVRRPRPLRTAITLDDDGRLVPRLYHEDAEAHELGSVLVSAVFDAFLTVFERKTARYVRLATSGATVAPLREVSTDLAIVLADEASQLASQFLAMSVRAIDYCPPVDLRFGEFLRAVITADLDLVPSDPWGYRDAWIDAFARHGIFPPNVRSLAEDELRWQPPERAIDPVDDLSFARLQFRGDPACAAGPDELHRQARALGALAARHPEAFGIVPPKDLVDRPCVQSVRSARRVGPDGQIVFDLVAEVTQRRVVRDCDGALETYGGATVLVGPNGNVRYVIAKHVTNADRLSTQRAFVRGPGRAFWRADARGTLSPGRQVYRRLHGDEPPPSDV